MQAGRIKADSVFCFDMSFYGVCPVQVKMLTYYHNWQQFGSVIVFKDMDSHSNVMAQPSQCKSFYRVYSANR